MQKAKLNYLIDVLLGISFLIVGITGIIKMPMISSALGLTYPVLRDSGFNFLHDWSGILMVILVIIHIALHWNWIVGMTKMMLSRK
jgi:hypothetical protein